MSEKIVMTKEILKKSMEIILELKITENDIEEINENLKSFQDNNIVREIMEEISVNVKNDNLKIIMNAIIEDMDICDLIKIVRIIANNKELVCFFQDFILKKTCTN